MKRTVLYDTHVASGAKIVEFGGWEMPLNYEGGILEEHLHTRRDAGLFDVSHMGRFTFRGDDAVAFLQHSLTNNAEALKELNAQYTMIPDERGGAVDAAYLYRFKADEYLLVVNASNKDKDWEHFSKLKKKFPKLEMTDISEEYAMVALQGPDSRRILTSILSDGPLPEPMRNELSIARIGEAEVMIARTGYTGEPLGFELFIPRKYAVGIWKSCVEKGAFPVGLGARDSLRLEAGLPLYGHELGDAHDGSVIPIFACPLARFAVSFSPRKGNFVGRKELEKQYDEYQRIQQREYSDLKILKRIIKPVAVTGKGVVRDGAKLFLKGKHIGWVTSGTMIPYWRCDFAGLASKYCEERERRAICLALIDSEVEERTAVDIEVRDKTVEGFVVPYFLRSEAPPFAWPALYPESFIGDKIPAKPEREVFKRGAAELLKKAADNTMWRQRECLNMIPSEMTQSPAARLLQVMDPAFRYAEHKKVKAFEEAEVFYYQGTGFIDEVETLLVEQMKLFLGCPVVETRVVSGQMANMAVFSAMVDFINRTDRKREPRRLRCVMNNHIIRGGHLSAQPMGALRDFVARDPQTEKPAVVNFPVCADNPYKIDIKEAVRLIEENKPELVILGKSMIIHREPVAEIKAALDAYCPDAMLMYDMAHVLGLIGPYFQEPFKEGANIVTGSTHKTFFGTQRGVIGGDMLREDKRWPFWEAVERRVFPGSVSNHHLGTLLGLLVAAYEMNYFKDEYQKQVISNAKTLAKALHHEGFTVAGDPKLSFTETHQVVVEIGYGMGIDAAQKLEANNIIVNFQASPREEGFTASGSLRLGVSELTRFGMKEPEMAEVASLMADLLLRNKNIKEKVKALKARFSELRFCFTDKEAADGLLKLRSLI